MIKEIAYENVQIGLNEKKVELLTGEEAMAMLELHTFLSEWETLYQACHWATVFQSPEFVTTWYKLYQHSHLPILISEVTDGMLTGLFTLALPHRKPRGRKFIVGAGHYEADYQTWLASEKNGNTFISAALKLLRQKYPTLCLMLRHLPPNTPINWAKAEPLWQNSCILYPLTRPLVVMSDFTVSRRDRKRVSRMQQIGKFIHLKEEEEFRASLDEVATYYDFRQGAMYNKNPFRDDPLNREFLLSLFRRKLLHVTVLKAGDETVASVAALISKNKANLGGINFHSPLFASYSPGYVHFLMLSQQFVHEGINSFDLTPGGDPYKDRLATQHDQVHILVIANSKPYYFKRQLRKLLYQRMTEMGIRTMSVELNLRRQLYFVKERGLLHEIKRRILTLWAKPQERLFQATLDLEKGRKLSPVNKNCLRDLLDYKMQGTNRTRWEFLEDAMRRFEHGQTSYTLTENDTLLFCIWYSTPAENPEDALCTVKNKEALRFQEIYVHPVAADRLRQFISSAISDIDSTLLKVQVYLPVPEQDKQLAMSMKRSGFKPAKG
jgi:CelD/BcsL family acetyltransferase involved in cellulose biosynthesis